MPGGAADYRLLYVSVAGSLLLHLAIVIGVQRAPPKEPPPRITATLREVAPPAAAAPAAAPLPALEPTPPSPAPAPPPPSPPKPETRAPTPPDPKKASVKAEEKPPEPRLLAPPTPTAPAPAVAAPVAPADPKPDAKPEAKSEPRVERDAPRPVPPAAPAPAATPVEPSERELVGRYQQQLADIIETRKLKRYPNDAMQNGWEGTATVLLKIGTDTKIAGVEVVVSSGHEILDEQARISISKAKPFVQVPEGLKGKLFEARVRVVFSLKN